MPCLLYPLRNSLKYHQAVTAASTDALTQRGNRQARLGTSYRETDLAQRPNTIVGDSIRFGSL